MPTPQTESLALRLRSILEREAKYSGLTLLTDAQFEGIVDGHDGEHHHHAVCSNSYTFGLVAADGRLWTVDVMDPDGDEKVEVH